MMREKSLDQPPSPPVYTLFHLRVRQLDLEQASPRTGIRMSQKRLGKSASPYRTPALKSRSQAKRMRTGGT
jgi:hypothetical protein